MMDFVFMIPYQPVNFVFGVSNVSTGAGSGGTINIYVNGVLNQTIISSDLDAEIINITP